jgi:WD40 repeat protein
MRHFIRAIGGFSLVGLTIVLIWYPMVYLRSEDGGFDALSPGGRAALTIHPIRSSHPRTSAISGDGRWFVTAGKDEMAHLWDLRQGIEIRQFKGHYSVIRASALSTDGSRLVTGSDDRTARLWDTATGELLGDFTGFESAIRTVALSGDGQWIALGGGEGNKEFRLLDAAGNRRILPGDVDGLYALALSDDGRWLAGAGDGIRLWDLQTGDPPRTFKRHGTRVRAIALSADARWLAAGSEDDSARLYDAPGGNLRRFYFEIHERPLVCVAISGDGQWIASCAEEKFVRVCAAADGEIRTLEFPTTIRSISLSRDGQWLFACGADGTHVCDVAKRKELCRLFSLRSGHWVVVDAVGRYDASNDGDIDDAHWNIHGQVVALRELKERCHDPGLLAKLMGFHAEPLRVVDE